MRVVFCYYGPNALGGPTTWVRRMLPRLKRRGLDVVAVPFHTRGGACDVADDLRRDGIQVEVVHAASSPVDSLRGLTETLARIEPDVIVADHVIPALVAGSWARQAGVATVMVLRSDDEWYRHLSATFLSGAADLRVAAVVAVSKELELTATAAAPRIDVVRCPSGVPVPLETARWSSRAFHAVYMGRLDQEQKRIPQLVRALMTASRALPHFSATLYGDGPLRGTVERTLGGEPGHRISYGGRIAPSQVQRQLLAAQALVLLSRYEGLSTSVQEAMACGLPIVARRTASGTDGVLIDGHTAIVLDDDDQLTEAVARLSDSETLWGTLSAGGRRLAAAEFDIELTANRWSALLARLGPNGRRRLSPLTRREAETLWGTYVGGKSDLDGSDVAFLIERGEFSAADAERFLHDRMKAWDNRRCVLYAAAQHGLLEGSGVTSRARELAHEGEAMDDGSDSHRYRLATLYRQAGDLDAAQDLFASVAATTTDAAMRAGSFYHLAAAARQRGRVADAKAWTDACLNVEPGHRAAAALRQQLAGAVCHG